MDSKQVVTDFNQKISETKDHLTDVLKTLRTGRANAAMLDGVMVNAYGASMPLKQVGGINTVGADMIQITPFDPTTLEAISQAIRDNSNLGLNPTDDGRVVRVPVPPLSEERRREIAKQINEKVEECHVRMRSLRHEAMDSIEKLKKDREIGEDDAKRLNKQVEDQMDSVKKSIETIAKEKESEIMSV